MEKMEKIDFKGGVKAGSIEAYLWIKQNKIIDWINEYEKQTEPTMRQAVQLMIEDMRKNG